MNFIARNAAVRRLAWKQSTLVSRQRLTIASGISSQTTEATGKLHSILDDYRRENFTQTLFSRYIKELVQAADVNLDGKISFSELKMLLSNIGAEGKMTEDELATVFDGLGHMENGEKLLYVDDIAHILNRAAEQSK